MRFLNKLAGMGGGMAKIAPRTPLSGVSGLMLGQGGNGKGLGSLMRRPDTPDHPFFKAFQAQKGLGAPPLAPPPLKGVRGGFGGMAPRIPPPVPGIDAAPVPAPMMSPVAQPNNDLFAALQQFMASQNRRR